MRFEKIIFFFLVICIFSFLSSCGNLQSTSVTPNEVSSSGTSSFSNKKDFNIEILNEYEIDSISGSGEFSYETFYDSQSGKTMPYRLHIPDNYSSSKKYPVLLFLHGLGEVGNDNESHMPNFIRCFTVANDILSEAIIICPQTPSSWSVDGAIPDDRCGYLSIAKRILDSNIQKYNGDRSRVYLTGLSLGSFANWTMLDLYPDFFAAAVPVCGGRGYSATQTMLETPIWMYHGTADTIVSYSSTKETYNAIKDAGGNKVKFTTLEGVDHNAWDYAYTDRNMFLWMFAQTLNGRYVESVNPIVLEVVADDGSVIFNENSVIDCSYTAWRGENYLGLNLSDEAAEALIREYDENNEQVFTIKFFGEKVYEFKLKASPNDNILYIMKTVNTSVFSMVYNSISEQ